MSLFLKRCYNMAVIYLMRYQNMPVLNLIITSVSSSVQGAFKKILNKKCAGCELSTGTMITFFALMFFVIFSPKDPFSPQVLPYCAIYAVSYATATATFIYALNCGSLALTQLVISYSTVIPLIYSIVFCNETLGFFKIIGLIFLFFSIIVTYYQKDKTKENAISLKWILLVVPMFFTNGMCSVASRMQQIEFGGAYDNSFLLVSLLMAAVILLVLAIIRERKNFTTAIKDGALLSGACGVSNGISNYFNLICLATIPNSIYYPVKSASCLILSGLISIVFFKEKLRPAQYVGMVLGVFAMIFINIP